MAVIIGLIYSTLGSVAAQHSVSTALRVSVQVLPTSTVTIQVPTTESSIVNSTATVNQTSLEVSCPSRGVFTVSIGAASSHTEEYDVRCDLPNANDRLNFNTNTRLREPGNFTPIVITY